MPAPALPSFEEFRQALLDEGFDEVLVRPWDADTVVPMHTHPFEAKALVVQGEMWLSVEDGPPEHLRPGDRFHLQPEVPHAERYGHDGAVYWVGRRAAPPPPGA